jgi:hypothetical protein
MRGLPVASPVQPALYDLLVTFPDGLHRVQVKTTTYRARQGSWRAGIGQRPYVLDKSASRMPYDPDAVDEFFVVDGDGGLYLIPSRVVAGRVGINVGAYARFVVGNAGSLFESAGGQEIDPSDTVEAFATSSSVSSLQPGRLDRR